MVFSESSPPHVPHHWISEVESLYLMWRTTKLQIYRNWGQRLLAAFYRRKTRLGVLVDGPVKTEWNIIP